MHTVARIFICACGWEGTHDEFIFELDEDGVGDNIWVSSKRCPICSHVFGFRANSVLFPKHEGMVPMWGE